MFETFCVFSNNILCNSVPCFHNNIKTQGNNFVKPYYVILHGMDLLCVYCVLAMLFPEMHGMISHDIHSMLFENA